jgi:hypothetical protein
MTEPQLMTADSRWRQRAFLTALYQARPCFICQARTWCAHREPVVDLAEHHQTLAEWKRTGE